MRPQSCGCSDGEQGHQNVKRRDGGLRFSLVCRYRYSVKTCTPVGHIGVGKEHHHMRRPVVADRVASVSPPNVIARFSYSLGGGFRSASGGSLAR